ncbi:hypothetical protein CQ14_39355 [Bradyrhizobium lablabi]|uniref:Uncharacterized protein n=1 Tax=Bradyrhizobium lablabi TaxID=722472 RepID=A0A0R3MM36_9BRAD|nr:hypothetical protein CQ14_39355 [Bradyrhizobium lablabi]
MHCIGGEVLWIGQRQRPGLRTSLWLKLLTKPLFQFPKVPWIDRDRQRSVLIIQQSPNSCCRAVNELLISKTYDVGRTLRLP